MALGTLLIIAIILGLIYFVLWILTLIKQAINSQWIWFIFTIIFGTIPLILYWLLGNKNGSYNNVASKQCKADGGKMRNGTCIIYKNGS